MKNHFIKIAGFLFGLLSFASCTGVLPPLGPTAYHAYEGLCQAAPAVQRSYEWLLGLEDCNDAYFGTFRPFQIAITLQEGEELVLEPGSWPPELADWVESLKISGPVGSSVVLRAGGLGQFPLLTALEFDVAVQVRLEERALEGAPALAIVRWSAASTVEGWHHSQLASIEAIGELLLPAGVVTEETLSQYSSKVCALGLRDTETFRCPAGGYSASQTIVDISTGTYRVNAGLRQYYTEGWSLRVCGLYFGDRAGKTCSSTSSAITERFVEDSSGIASNVVPRESAEIRRDLELTQERRSFEAPLPFVCEGDESRRPVFFSGASNGGTQVWFSVPLNPLPRTQAYAACEAFGPAFMVPLWEQYRDEQRALQATPSQFRKIWLGRIDRYSTSNGYTAEDLMPAMARAREAGEIARYSTYSWFYGVYNAEGDLSFNTFELRDEEPHPFRCSFVGGGGGRTALEAWAAALILEQPGLRFPIPCR